jgi:hypothetical protein
VDAHAFWREYTTGDTLKERELAIGNRDDRSVVDILVDQVRGLVGESG